MYRVLWISTLLLIFVWSAIEPKDRFTWFLEVAPVIIATILMTYTYHSFRLTNLLYILILVHMIILMVGGHYTYAEVPLFDTIRDILGQDRNNYDKIGHLAQGFIPAMVAREIFIRKKVVNGKRWLVLFVLSITLAFSAFYELIEWWVALYSGEDAEAFLGTQGYIWDTQSDMGHALLGSILALLSLSKIHDRELSKI